VSDKSDYLEGEIIKHLFRTGSFTKPTILGIALFTVAPNKETGAGGTEVTGGTYNRIDTPPLDANWDAVTSGGDTANTSVITFDTPTANWGTIVAFGIYDALTAGNLMYSANLTTSKTVNNGDPAPTFPAGSLTVSEQ
jgi:hypothetical protein